MAGALDQTGKPLSSRLLYVAVGTVAGMMTAAVVFGLSTLLSFSVFDVEDCRTIKKFVRPGNVEKVNRLTREQGYRVVFNPRNVTGVRREPGQVWTLEKEVCKESDREVSSCSDR